MMTWLIANSGTILVLAILLTVVTAILFTMRRDRKRGRTACGVRCGGCGGSCSHCAGGCHG